MFKQKKKVKKSINFIKTTKKQKKCWLFWSFIVVVVCGLVGVAAALIFREYRRAERQKYYAEQEAKMQDNVFSFTIKPGETIFDIKKGLIEVGYTKEEVDEAFLAEYEFDFLKKRPNGASLEGYLFGETHEFYKTTPAREVLEKFLEHTEEVISENNLEVRFKKQGLSLHEGITLASIVQKEAKTSEMATVAQVFLLRLDSGWRLDSDVTVSYALDVIDPERKIYNNNQSALDIDSCYNTRLYTGLPCGPIANPSISALLAVANPTDTSYLYFLTGDDGMMYYSYTDSEHNQNIDLHCETLCKTSL